MPPLTLEQVLARSMRLPRQRARQTSRLYHNFDSKKMSGSFERDSTRSVGETLDGSASPSNKGVPSGMGLRHVGRHGVTELSGVATAAANKSLNFFELMEREDAQRRAGRLTIHTSGHLVRNSGDLTTYLKMTQRTGDWEGGLRAFAEATALPSLKEMLTTPDAVATATGSTEATSVMSTSSRPALSGCGISPNAQHITAVLDMCAQAEKWDLVEKIAVFFAPACPDALCCLVDLLARRQPSGPDAGSCGWRAAFAYLTTRCPLPAAEISVEAFNVCLRGCEAALDWRGALEVVRAMGPNPLQGWRAAEEEAGEADSSASEALHHDADAVLDPTEGDSMSSSPPAASVAPSPSLSTPPSPNVVSYATLIATLEQSGKEGIASEVLNRLPAVEKEEITASYAALIMVWSNQILQKQRHRF